ncbi:uncharacterized protein BGW36DRAFT_374845 [Neofusicoccum parvum]|uniref:Uncharacterized protein BGW36DRAFT_374845 n=1 Tax=Neofusicoccum parvum TaxID=310453 RepID=A0ACB5SBW6_9PEZI|nr:uncharacterized protein BGW36DRAFT_374845 [Neofusicoccum parvum]
MHHYSTATYKTLIRDQTDLEIWRDAVPADAGTYEFLMDGILAFASLHVALENPEKRKRFTERALSYHNSGLQQFSDILPFMNPDNCDALFVFAVTTALLTLVGDHHRWLKSGKLRALFTKVRTASPETAEETRGDAIESVRQIIFAHAADMDGEERGFYESAVGTLDACSGLGLDGVNIGALVAFPILIDGRLISHLSENRYAALMMFLYYGTLMSQLEDRWWARMFGRQLVEDVNSLINTFHGQCRTCNSTKSHYY